MRTHPTNWGGTFAAIVSFAAAALAGLPSADPAWPPMPAVLLDHFRNQVLPFFLARTPDWMFGGYNVNIGPKGKLVIDVAKALVPQSRQLYMFSAGVQRTGAEHRARLVAAARLGKTFIAEKMRDPVHGGFWEQVTRDGRQVIENNKRTYSQAFAIYGLAEFAVAMGDADALSHAVGEHARVREKMWDRDHGGFFRTAKEDWSIMDDRKKIDDHLHLLEAVWSLYAATHRLEYRNEIAELSDFILRAFFRGPDLEEAELVLRDLSIAPGEPFREDHTGHSMETAWFLLRASRLLGRTDFRRAGLTIVDRVLRENFDGMYGGIVPIALDGERSWWTQCEGVMALALAAHQTAQASYRDAFDKALEFTLRSFPDRAHGGWHATVSRSGDRGWGEKAGTWKAGYHETQMLTYVRDLLSGKNSDPER